MRQSWPPPTPLRGALSMGDTAMIVHPEREREGIVHIYF
jgi:hypothetical protein